MYTDCFIQAWYKIGIPKISFKVSLVSEVSTHCLRERTHTVQQL